MPASSSDYFKKARRKFVTTVGVGGISNSGTTLPLTTTTNLDTDTAVIVVVDAYDASGVATPSFEEVIAGVVSGSNIIGCLRGLETTSAQAHAEGAIVTMYFTESHWDGLINGLLVQHKQDGSHSSITADNLTVGGLSIAQMATPTGAISMFGGSAAPSGWLLCDGSAVSRSTYSALFTAVSTAYGTGNGTTTFNLPDLRGRVAVGKDSGTFPTLGGTGGEETHVLDWNEMPAHAHGVNDPGHSHGVRIASTTSTSAGGDIRGVGVTNNQNANYNSNGSGTGITTQNAGSSTAHNNLQPYQVVNYIIKT